MILSNQVRCLQCDDTPYSAHRHDMRWCKCGSIAVDGGMDYPRRVGGTDGYEEMSVYMPQMYVDGLLAAIGDETRNDLGKLCNVVRYLRDEMGINVSKMEED